MSKAIETKSVLTLINIISKDFNGCDITYAEACKSIKDLFDPEDPIVNYHYRKLVTAVAKNPTKVELMSIISKFQFNVEEYLKETGRN